MQILECDCGRQHIAPIDVIKIGVGVIDEIPKILDKYNSIYLVADENTFLAAGKKVIQILELVGKHISVCIVKYPALPTAHNIGSILLEYPKSGANYILGVGSGSINDMCRIISVRMNLPYGIVCTAPSMDGYSSNISPIIYNNTKTTFKGTTPRHIIADTLIISKAPYDMLLAGIGDMAGKYIAILDWEMAREFNGEYFCRNIANMVISATDKCLSLANKITSRDVGTVEKVVEGLIVSGLCMSYTGISRPASGSEHMCAHTWEIMDIVEGRLPKLHGQEVAQGAMVMSIMYQKLYSETKDLKVKSLINKYIDKLNGLKDIYINAGMKWVVTDKNMFNTGIKNAINFRKRFTILEYLNNNGVLDEYIDFVVDNWEM